MRVSGANSRQPHRLRSPVYRIASPFAEERLTVGKKTSEQRAFRSSYIMGYRIVVASPTAVSSF
jgi:hypothetical protein